MKPYKSKLNQSTQKGGIQGTKWKAPCPRRPKKTTYKGKPQGEHQISEPLVLCYEKHIK
jgi:hypothetical protein